MSSVAPSDPADQSSRTPCDHRVALPELRDPPDDPPFYCPHCYAAMGEHEAWEIIYAIRPGIGKILDRKEAEEREAERREAAARMAERREQLEQQQHEQRAVRGRAPKLTPPMPVSMTSTAAAPTAPGRANRSPRTGTGRFTSISLFKSEVVKTMTDMLRNEPNCDLSQPSVAERLGVELETLQYWCKKASKQSGARWALFQTMAKVKWLAEQ